MSKFTIVLCIVLFSMVANAYDLKDRLRLIDKLKAHESIKWNYVVLTDISKLKSCKAIREQKNMNQTKSETGLKEKTKIIVNARLREKCYLELDPAELKIFSEMNKYYELIITNAQGTIATLNKIIFDKLNSTDWTSSKKCAKVVASAKMYENLDLQFKSNLEKAETMAPASFKSGGSPAMWTQLITQKKRDRPVRSI